MPDPIGTGNNPYDPQSGTQTGTGSAVMPIYGRPSGWADPTYQGNGMYDYPNYMGPWDNPYKYDPRRFSMGYGQPPQQQSWGWGQQGYGQPQQNWGQPQQGWGQPQGYGGYNQYAYGPGYQSGWANPVQQPGFPGTPGTPGGGQPPSWNYPDWQNMSAEDVQKAIAYNASYVPYMQSAAEIAKTQRDQDTSDYRWGTEWSGNRADTAWSQGFQGQTQADLVRNREQIAKQAELDSVRSQENSAISALGRRNYGNVRYSW